MIDNPVVTQPPTRGSWARSLLVAVPVAAAIGPYASPAPSTGSAASLYRLLCVLAVLPALAAAAAGRPLGARAPKMFLLLALIWSLWAPLTLFRAPDPANGVKELVSVSFALGGGLLLVLLSKGTDNGARLINLGWVWAFVITGAVGAWEVHSGQHLEGNLALQLSGLHYAASTFFNPNNYAGFLLACLPSLAMGGFRARTGPGRLLYGGLIVAWLCLVIATQSRTGLFGILLIAPPIGYWFAKVARARGRDILLPAALTLGALAAILAALAASGPGRQVLGDFQSPFRETGGLAHSDEVRLNLTRFGWQVFWHSGLLGRGPGSFAEEAFNQRSIDTAGLTNAHNSVAELAAEYGILVLAPLLALLWVVVAAALRTRVTDRYREDVLCLRMAILLEAAAFVASSLAASSVLAAPWWWILLGQMTAQGWLLSRISAAGADVAPPGARIPGDAGPNSSAADSGRVGALWPGPVRS